VVINFNQRTGLVEVFQSAASSVRKKLSC
jgi:hypothetical protein